MTSVREFTNLDPEYNRWFNRLIKRSRYSIENINLGNSKEWEIKNGAIRHKSGGFFRVVGVEWTDDQGKKHAQPLIEQREVGTLGFLMRVKNSHPEVLVQAKIEPGNVGTIQLAPTCQATASNASRVHGGELPPYFDWFSNNKQGVVYDTLQSEQGTRFLDKQNRNVLRVTNSPVPLATTHRWLPAEKLLKLMAVDFLINTDARSVLVCSPWEQLVNRAPFSKTSTPFSIDLAKSYSAKTSQTNLTTLKNTLKHSRALAKRPKVVKLQSLKGWKLNQDQHTVLKGTGYSVRHLQVTASGREVPSWDQPLLSSSGIGQIDLICGRIDGLLHFLFCARYEPGLYNSVELGPTTVIEPGKKTSFNLGHLTSSKVRIKSKQSEEGGRFFNNINHYRIIDVGETSAYRKAPGCFWLTLAQLQQLLSEEGWLTNEARSVLSFLLFWL